MTAVRGVFGAMPVSPIVVGGTDDPAEREAEDLARRIENAMRGAARSPLAASSATAKADAPAMELRRFTSVPAQGGAITDLAFVARLQQPGAGQSLPAVVQTAAESVLGVDLAHVRVHRASGDDAGALSARAFTLGSNIWLAPGVPFDDHHLLGHELAHVAQHARSSRPVLRRGLLDDGLSALRSSAASRMREVPGYEALTIGIEYEPILGVKVERTAERFVRSLLRLLPDGGERLYDDLQRSGSIKTTFEWLQQEWAALGFSRDYALRLLDRLQGVPFGIGYEEKLLAIVAEPLKRLLGFVARVASKALELALLGALRVYPKGAEVIATLRRAGDVFGRILADPKTFLRNVVAALQKGVTGFVTRIGAHLQAGFIDWLVGPLRTLGVTLPKEWDLRGVAGVALQVLNLSWTTLRTKLVKRVGEASVKVLEAGVELVRAVIDGGLTAAWSVLRTYLGSLRDAAFDALKRWLVDSVVAAGVKQLLKVVGGFVSGGLTTIIEVAQQVYHFVEFLSARVEQIRALVDKVVESLDAIVKGNLEPAADGIEQTMSRTIPFIIGFLTNLLGIPNPSAEVARIVKELRSRVDEALDRLVDWIVTKGTALLVSTKDRVVDAVSSWWQMLFAFKGGGEEHELRFAGQGGAARAMVHSDPLPAGKFIETHAQNAEDSNNKEGKRAAQAARAKLDSLEAAILAAPELDAASPAKLPGTRRINATAKQLIQALASMLDAVQPSQDETQFALGPLNGGEGTFATAMPLTARHKAGSAPSENGDLWSIVRRWPSSKGRSTHFVRGHLINHNLGGPGTRPNLTPITRQANKQHLDQVERAVKGEFEKRKGNNKRPVRLKYTVQAKYGGMESRLSGVRADVKATEFDASRRKSLLTVVDAMSKLATSFLCEWNVIGDAKAKGRVAVDLTVGIPTVVSEFPLRDDLDELPATADK